MRMKVVMKHIYRLSGFLLLLFASVFAAEHKDSREGFSKQELIKYERLVKGEASNPNKTVVVERETPKRRYVYESYRSINNDLDRKEDHGLYFNPLDRQYGLSGGVGFGGLFARPLLRSAKGLDKSASEVSLSYSYHAYNKYELTPDFKSNASIALRSVELQLRYGLCQSAEIYINTAMSKLSGSLSLIPQNNPVNVINSGKASMDLDDMQLGVQMMIGSGRSSIWERIVVLLQNPLLDSASASQSIGFALKLPVGKTDHYLSSGKTDVVVSLRSSYEEIYMTRFSLDVNYHYIFNGGMDTSMFADRLHGKDFFLGNWVLSYHSNSRAFLYAGVNYRSGQMDIDVDLYKNEGISSIFGASLLIKGKAADIRLSTGAEVVSEDSYSLSGTVQIAF